MLAAYFDESATGRSTGGIVTVAVTLASLAHWERFEQLWRPVLQSAGRERQFHAVKQDRVQAALNKALPKVIKESGAWTLCTTFNRRDYLENTSAVDRSQLGNDHGFAWFACAAHLARFLREDAKVDAGYFIDQGGLGSAKAIEALSWIYGSDKLRAEWRLADYGPADRRIHLPVHPSDLVAHEVTTNRQDSLVLSELGDFVSIIDVSGKQIRAVMAEYRGVMTDFKREAQRRKNTRKRYRKSHNGN